MVIYNHRTIINKIKMVKLKGYLTYFVQHVIVVCIKYRVVFHLISMH